jgi:hypothetical protein
MRSHSINFWGRSSQISVEICEMEHSNPQPWPPQQASYPVDPQSYVPWTPPQFGGYQEPANWTGNPPINQRSGSLLTNVNDVDLQRKKRRRKYKSVAGSAGGMGIVVYFALRFALSMGAQTFESLQTAETVAPPTTSYANRLALFSNPLHIQDGQCFPSVVLFDGHESESLAKFVEPCKPGSTQLRSSGLVTQAEKLRAQASCPGEYWTVVRTGMSEEYGYCLVPYG